MGDDGTPYCYNAVIFRVVSRARCTVSLTLNLSVNLYFDSDYLDRFVSAQHFPTPDTLFVGLPPPALGSRPQSAPMGSRGPGVAAVQRSLREPAAPELPKIYTRKHVRSL